MKIWYGFGSEHSANLMMIGRFKTSEDAKAATLVLERLKNVIESNFDYDRFYADRMSVFDDDAVRGALSDLKIYGLSPEDLESFYGDHIVKRKGNNVLLQTEEWKLSGFMKVMVERGARIEVYSGHFYPCESSADSQLS